MNFEIANTQNKFGMGVVGIISTVGFERGDNPDPEMSSAEYETYAQTVLTEISRIRNVAREEARRFVDFSTFDEIVECLRSGLSAMGDLEPGILAMTFCHISTN